MTTNIILSVFEVFDTMSILLCETTTFVIMEPPAVSGARLVPSFGTARALGFGTYGSGGFRSPTA